MAQHIWEVFPKVTQRIDQSHSRVGLHGHHDIAHAKRVGEVARMVAMDEWDDEHLSHLAGLAGLTHNSDRVLQKERGMGRRDVPAQDVQALIWEWLADAVPDSEKTGITDAVLRHDGLNSEDDSNIQIALQDADRIISLDADLMIRSGQYYHDLPAVDYVHFLGDPNASYRAPGTVLRDIAYSLDWIDPKSSVCIRTRLGKIMGESRARIFRTFFDALANQLTEEGLPLPPPNRAQP